jgi:ATP-binding protein involved in chromosome partitioning
LAKELGFALLGQIPIVQSIREGGDDGQPVALTGRAFSELADNLIAAVDKRNREQPKTQVVKVSRK